MLKALAGFGVIVAAVASRAWAVDVTACGQIVPAGEVGVLQVDLHCNGGPRVCVNSDLASCTTGADCIYEIPGAQNCSSIGVVVGKGASLDLNGHSIVADGTTGYGVYCAQPNRTVPCTVYGPGEVMGGSAGVGGGKLTIHDVSVHDAGVAGVFASGAVTATNVSVDHIGYEGLYTGGRIQATNLTANDTGYVGILAGTLRGTGITANGNVGPGVQVYKQVNVTGLTAQNNGDAGVYSYGGGKLADSIVTGNTYDGATLDVLMHYRPRLKNTTCGVSGRLPKGILAEPAGTWGVCTGD